MTNITQKLRLLVLYPLILLACFIPTYLFALAGEPQSVWLMCDVLSLCEAPE